MTILIIGAGEIGKALAHVLRRHDVILWDKNSSIIPNQPPLNNAIKKADVVIIAAPSWANRDIAKKISKYAIVDHPKLVISVSKGLEKNSGDLVPDILQHELESHPSAPIRIPYGLLTGPMIAEDLQKGKSTSAVLALSDNNLRSLTNNMFVGSIIKIVLSSDLTSTALASVLKNIYSIGVGAAYAQDDNETQLNEFRTNCLIEMRKIITEFGGSASVIDSPAGKEDFFVTSSTEDSSNYHTGVLLQKKLPLPKTCEGLASIDSIVNKIHDINKYPILNSIYKLTRGE